jgi:pyrophosphatase PpaX
LVNLAGWVFILWRRPFEVGDRIQLGAVPSETVFVGDSPHDMAAGNGAGVATAAVLWGPFPRSTLEGHDPDFWISDPAELTALVT